MTLKRLSNNLKCIHTDSPFYIKTDIYRRIRGKILRQPRLEIILNALVNMDSV